MKRQKLLLPFKGRTIIEAVIENILKVADHNILVVLGSHHYEISEQISKLPVTTCFNKEYRKGMLSSVICGFRSLPENAGVVLIYLGDQPQIPSEVAELVISSWRETRKSIVIPVFEGRRGHPVLIETKYRSEIENLDHNKGLRQLMDLFPREIHEVECGKPEILRDIDTPGDYKDEISKASK